jgi:O-antigen/teichoic acid export membrane protein
MSPAASQVRTDVRRTLARNTTWNYVGLAVNLVTNFLLFPFVVRTVGDAAAGVWLLLGSITGYMGLMELGIVPSLTQHVAAAMGRGTSRDVDRAASTALAMLIGLMVLALQSLWFVPALVGMLQVPAHMHQTAEAILMVSLTGFALKMPQAAFQALLLGCQRQDRANQLWVLLAFAKALATVALLLTGFGILAVVVAEAALHLLAGVLQVRWARQELPTLVLRWQDVESGLARQLVGLGGALLLTNICALVIEQTDRLVVGAFLPIEQVTHYAAGFKLYMLAFAVPTTLVQAVAPLAGLLHGRDDRPALTSLFLRMTKYTAAVAMLLVGSLAFASGALLDVWMGGGFVEVRHVVQVLCAAFAVTAFNHAGYSALIGTRRIAPLLWRYWLPQAILNLVVSVWLVHSLGIVGVALGTAIPALVLEPVFLSYLLREMRVGWREFLASTAVPVVAPAVVAFAPLAVAYHSFAPSSRALLVVAALCCVLYATLFWFLGLGRGERADLIDVLARRTGTSLAQSA